MKWDISGAEDISFHMRFFPEMLPSGILSLHLFWFPCIEIMEA